MLSRPRLLAAPVALLVALLAGCGGSSSRDRSLIAFDRFSEHSRNVYLVAPDGSRLHSVTLDGSYSPAWSPDGKRIAFTSHRKLNDQIYVMNADGSGRRRLTRDASDDTGPAWSPDGKRIAFASDHTDAAGIYVMNADGSGRRRLPHTGEADTQPAWSPDGKSIVFARDVDGVFDNDLYVMHADGGHQRPVTDGATFDDDAPAWQPGG